VPESERVAGALHVVHDGGLRVEGPIAGGGRRFPEFGHDGVHALEIAGLLQGEGQVGKQLDAPGIVGGRGGRRPREQVHRRRHVSACKRAAASAAEASPYACFIRRARSWFFAKFISWTLPANRSSKVS